MKKILNITIILILFCLPLLSNKIVPIGQKEGPGMLFVPAKQIEGPDGNIYIYDIKDSTIKIYSSGGKYLRRIARKGQGPGEIQRSDGFNFGFTDENTLFFTEFFQGHPWITTIDLNGKLKSVVKFKRNDFFGVLNSTSLSDKKFLVEFHSSGIPKQKEDFYYHNSPIELALVDSNGEILSTIKKTDYFTRISFLPSGADSPIPFVPIFLWKNLKENRVLFTDGLSTKLKVFDNNGNLMNEIPTPLPTPEKVKSKDLKKWREERKEMMISRNPGWYNRFGKVVEKYKKSIHKIKPNISSLQITPEGNILLAGQRKENTDKLDYWLINQKGQMLEKITTSGRAIVITQHFILFRTTDIDTGSSTFALNRSGSEESDLKQIESYLSSL